MDEFLSEREQVEVLRRWWRENGAWIIGGLVVGIAALFGWRVWSAHQLEQAEAASAVYGELLAAVDRGDREQGLSIAATLAEDYSGTPYADHAGLALAKLHMDAGEADAAAAALQTVLESTGDAELAHIARLRLARVRLQQGQPEAAAELLEDVDEGGFAALYAALRGDIHVARDDVEAARAAYRRALAIDAPGIIDRNVVQMKLDALGSGAEAGEAGTPEPAS
ncbi:MAG TPA: tetratricopeptide repeat protein [Gammaproteobacteria bacterium]|nr:tetratricopeptide repeat protein [Gammaproteobacteria bacterium]